MIGPTSVFKKNYNRHTLGLLLLCLKVALGPGGREISILTEFVHVHFACKIYILYKFKVLNFI